MIRILNTDHLLTQIQCANKERNIFDVIVQTEAFKLNIAIKMDTLGIPEA